MSRYIWKTTADRTVRRYYPSCGAVIVAEMLGIEPWQVRYYASKIGIRTRNRGGRPFTSNDPRRSVGRRFRRAA